MEQGQGMEAPSGGGAQRVADVKLQVSAAGFGKLSIDGHEIGAYVEAVSLSGGGLDSFGDRVLTRVNVTLLADVEFEGKGVQVVYDSVGVSTFLRGLDVLAPRGMMVLFGQSSGPVEPMKRR